MIEIDVLIEGKKFPQNSSSVVLVKETVSEEITNNYLLDTGSYYDRNKLINVLTERKLNPHDIRYVILSHWHVDHIGNIDLFSNAKIIATEDCINTNIELDRFIGSLKSEDEIEEMTELLMTLFSDSDISRAKFRAMANLSIHHKEQIAYICEAFRHNCIRIIKVPYEGILSNLLSVYKFDCHTKEDIVTKVQLTNNSAFFMGDVILDSDDNYFLEKYTIEDLDIVENDLVIPGHGKPFYWSGL